MPVGRARRRKIQTGLRDDHGVFLLQPVVDLVRPWGARGTAGLNLAAGVYFLRLRGVASESRAVQVLLIP